MKTADVFVALMLACATLNLEAFSAETKDASESSAQAIESRALRQELDSLISLYKTGTQEEQMLAVNRRIKFSGITSIELFDIAEKNLLSIDPKTINRRETQYGAWMAQMLAFSGQEKYLPTLYSVLAKAKARSLKQHLTTSIAVLPQYKVWNATISKNLETVPANELYRTRIFNMLNATDPELMRAGASITEHYYLNDEQITDLIEQRLLVIHKRATKVKNDQFAEASAWFCKVLGHTTKEKYLKTLDLLSESDVDAINRWANRARLESKWRLNKMKEKNA